MKFFSRAALASPLLLAGLAACGRNPDLRPPPSPVGCYQIERSAEARQLGLPWGFELLPGELEGWPGIPEGHPAVTRVSATRTADHPFAFWMRTEGDSIRVGHPGGGGFSLTLSHEGLRLEGSALPAGDVVRPGEGFGPRPAQPVVAHEVLCEDAG